MISSERRVQWWIATVMEDRPTTGSKRELKRWAQRWQNYEVELFNHGRTYQWYTLKEALNRLGLWDKEFRSWYERVLDPVVDFLVRILPSVDKSVSAEKGLNSG